MLDGPRFVALHPGRGVWAATGHPQDLEFWLHADRLILPPDAVVSHVTGLRLHGVEIGPISPRHWSTNEPQRRRSQGLVLHRRQARLLPIDVGGTPVLPADRCLVDAAIDLSHRDIVRVGDALIAAGLIEAELFGAYVWGRHLHGVQRSRANLALLRDRVRSFRETDLRLMLGACGLPEPEVNAQIVVPHAPEPYMGDLVLRRWKVVIEYDGWYHERSAWQRRKDLRRREDLEADGWLVIVVVSGDLDRPANLIGRIWRALVSRGYDGRPPTLASGRLEELARDPRS